jgi:hypothetical protein
MTFMGVAGFSNFLKSFNLLNMYLENRGEKNSRIQECQQYEAGTRYEKGKFSHTQVGLC